MIWNAFLFLLDARDLILFLLHTRDVQVVFRQGEQPTALACVAGSVSTIPVAERETGEPTPETTISSPSQTYLLRYILP